MNNDTEKNIKTKPKMELINRQCWICLQSEFKEEINPISGKHDLVDPNEKWLTPCCCKGSTQYVHEECLLNWIKMKREMDEKNKLHCPSCQTPYTILIPKKTLLQKICISTVKTTNSLLRYSPIIIKYICILFCIWEFSYIYGKLILNSIFEKELSNNKIDNEIKDLMYRCFSASLLIMLFIPWEFSFLISAAIMHFTDNKEIMITMILLYTISCDFFPSAIRLILNYIYTLKLNLGLKNDEKIREQRRLLKLSKSVTFPNARVHINENFISPSSFTLKINIMEDTQNLNQANPQILYVEYEKAIILLAVLKSKIFHFLLNETNRGNNLFRQQAVNNNLNNNNNQNNNNNNNNIRNNIANNMGNENNNNNINININKLNKHLSISTINANEINNINNMRNNLRSDVNNLNDSSSHNKHHKKCQSMPPFLNKDFLKNKAYSCDALNNRDCSSLATDKILSINNVFDSNNYNSLQNIINSPKSNKKYNEMIDSNIDIKLRSSLKNIILSNKENNFMKILNKQKSLYTKLTNNNNEQNTITNKQKKIEKSNDKETIKLVDDGMELKIKQASLSNDSLNKPSSSDTSNYISKKLPALSPKNNKSNNLQEINNSQNTETQRINKNDKNDINNENHNAINNNDDNNNNNNLNNTQNINNRRTKEAYLTININNVNTHIKNLIIKTLSLPIIALVVGRLIHWVFLIIQLFLKYINLNQNMEYNEIINDFKVNHLIYTAIGIFVTSSFNDLCHLYYHYSKNIEKEKLVVLNHKDTIKNINNYTTIN
ncbi:hypothetical protein BCR36DRAFT_330575 [Piromyces finnis]|uniref:RING-CH-type domain-containing protein n=1 Tax=Piromyces finnis TaxID=1754191 RepID=A0A1Y1V4M2_9FUNG|nr:hypothetical protein BCR36DRAFT_330575 [Piromyces finnis]|eukprot:ORX47277.1 hypothetical protein BCR36DRAFT_330575 [Piromyces finnis]